MDSRQTLTRIIKTLQANPVQFWVLAGFLALIFLAGGSSRTDVQSLILLRPASVLACGLALLTLRREHLHGRVWLMAGFVAMTLLAILQLLPLPPVLQEWFGHDMVVAVDSLAATGDVWRPFTQVPLGGWQALLSLSAPLAVLLLGIQLRREELYRLLPVLIGMGAVSGMFGLLQSISDPEGPLYLYRITNDGSAVGLFANRNHAAVLLACMFPLLATFACMADEESNQQYVRRLLAAGIAIVLVPLILVTGSRSGMLISGLGLVAAALLYRSPRKTKTMPGSENRFKTVPMPLLAGIAIVCLGFVTLYFSRAEAIDRLFEGASSSEDRREFWAVSFDMIWKYFPFGSGSGSFAEAYQINEPYALLAATYLNRAHNDWIETVLTFGLPGLALLLLALFFYVRRTFMLWRISNGKRRSVGIARMAGFAIIMIALASLSDYPLRTPIMMCFMVVMTLFFTEAGRHEQMSRISSPPS